jgi:CelD/BcsL family acetyltransferase involved in cellulose biosynthesis
MRLKRDKAPGEVILEFNRPAKIENATRIIALNRTTIESKGKRYGVDTNYEADIVAACTGTGVDISLFVGSKLISGAIFYVCGKRAFLQTVGYDGEFAKYSPGLLCLSEAIKRFQAMGLLEINLMWGGYNYKEQLGGKRESLVTYTFVRNEKALLSPMHVARAIKLTIVMPAKSRILSLVRPLVRTLKEKVVVPRKSS